MNRGANYQAKDLQLAAHRDHGCYMLHVSKMCTCSYNQTFSIVPQWCYQNSLGINREILRQNKGFNR